MSLHKNCGWWKNSDWIFEFSVKIYVANTTNLSCAKILLPSVMGVVLRHGYRWNCRKVRPCLEAKVPKHTEAAINRNMALRQHLIMLCFSRVTQSTRPAGRRYRTDGPQAAHCIYIALTTCKHDTPGVTGLAHDDICISTDLTSDQTVFRLVTSIFLVECSSLLFLRGAPFGQHISDGTWSFKRRCLRIYPAVNSTNESSLWPVRGEETPWDVQTLQTHIMIVITRNS